MLGSAAGVPRAGRSQHRGLQQMTDSRLPIKPLHSGSVCLHARSQRAPTTEEKVQAWVSRGPGCDQPQAAGGPPPRLPQRRPPVPTSARVHVGSSTHSVCLTTRGPVPVPGSRQPQGGLSGTRPAGSPFELQEQGLFQKVPSPQQPPPGRGPAAGVWGQAVPQVEEEDCPEAAETAR